MYTLLESHSGATSISFYRQRWWVLSIPLPVLRFLPGHRSPGSRFAPVLAVCFSKPLPAPLVFSPGAPHYDIYYDNSFRIFASARSYATALRSSSFVDSVRRYRSTILVRFIATALRSHLVPRVLDEWLGACHYHRHQDPIPHDPRRRRPSAPRFRGRILPGGFWGDAYNFPIRGCCWAMDIL